jgi:hypothetical protein
MTDFIKSKFVSAGIGAGDALKGIVIFKSLFYMLWIAGVPICYKYRPLQHIYNKSTYIQSLAVKYPWISGKIQHGIQFGTNTIANNRFFKPIPVKLNLDPKRFAMALGENTIAYKLLLPISMPTFFFMTVAMISKK